MQTAKKSWQEKLHSGKFPKKVRLDSAYAGMRAGHLMLVSTPELVDQAIRRIPPGTCITVKQLRRDLARDAACDGTCAISTGMFVRIAAEAAWEELEAGKSLSEVTPFWRVISPDMPVAQKLSCGVAWLSAQRCAEGLGA